jgi:hypothetical protein
MTNIRSIICVILFVAIARFNVYSQSARQVDSLLSAVCLTKQSKDIVKNKQAKKLIAGGTKLLPVLAGFFTDNTLTTVRSECQGRFFNKGEVAIILADHIEMMPYYTVTGIQNCMLDFCKDNPNGIEIYMNVIKGNGIVLFYKNYSAWLNSNDRKKWPPYIANKINRKTKTL